MSFPATIGVVIPTRNRVDTLPRALDSVLQQSHPVEKVVVVDDGSDDDTAGVLADLAGADQRVTVLRTKGVGASAARNLGIAHCDTDFIAFQDSDDRWRKDFVSSLLPHVGSNVVAFGSHILTRLDGSTSYIPSAPVVNPARQLLRTNPISTQTILADRQLFDLCRFDEHLRRFQDWDLWLSMLTTCEVSFIHVDQPVVEVYRQTDSISESDRVIRKAALKRIFRKHRSLFMTDPVALSRIVARAYVRP